MLRDFLNNILNEIYEHVQYYSKPCSTFIKSANLILRSKFKELRIGNTGKTLKLYFGKSDMFKGLLKLTMLVVPEFYFLCIMKSD